MGSGFCCSVEGLGFGANKSIVLGIDDDQTYAGHEVNAEIGIGVIGFSSSNTHLSEKHYDSIICGEHAYERKTIFNILSCPDTIGNNSFNIGPFSVDSKGDFSVSLQGSTFYGIGVGGSIGINISEFLRGVFE